jgi:methylmalonyl-CoA/ethylmalonyl-CoA epimerase
MGKNSSMKNHNLISFKSLLFTAALFFATPILATSISSNEPSMTTNSTTSSTANLTNPDKHAPSPTAAEKPGKTGVAPLTTTGLKVKELEQVGMVVYNLEESVKKMWHDFGIGPWDVYVNTHTPDLLKEVKYYGKPSSSGMKIAMAQVGPMQIELIEPIGTDNIYADFLKKHGEGIQHLGWYKTKTEKEFFEKMHELEQAGFPCIFSGRSYRSRFAYFDTTKALHTIFEIIWVDQKIPPRPSYKFPAK